MGITRKTKSLELLLQTFEKRKEAISVVDLVDKLKNEVNKTTVYRSLERLEDEGILHSFIGQDSLRWYAKCNGCSSSKHKDIHPHFQCKKCGKTECISLDLKIPKVQNHKIESAALLLLGTCENCN